MLIVKANNLAAARFMVRLSVLSYRRLHHPLLHVCKAGGHPCVVSLPPLSTAESPYDFLSGWARAQRPAIRLLACLFTCPPTCSPSHSPQSRTYTHSRLLVTRFLCRFSALSPCAKLCSIPHLPASLGRLPTSCMTALTSTRPHAYLPVRPFAFLPSYLLARSLACPPTWSPIPQLSLAHLPTCLPTRVLAPCPSTSLLTSSFSGPLPCTPTRLPVGAPVLPATRKTGAWAVGARVQ